ncbi:MBL fold metallo-hydrolase [Desnuesiella massiliensis]|uniref:MBL fold metallo-hydrolase n=1 Tax=Desnuesiella massiliensis TaxID=1650662 RepID=UPI00093DD768|nr:MBL fold metallo-hydrolase [Desnuesiella massiliensis]
MKILNLTCKLTNCYLIESNSGWIMIDTDWPDTLNQFLCLLKENDIQIPDIKYLVVTHFHPDHAGIAQDLKNLGVNLVLHENQVSFVEKLNNFFKKNPKFNYKDIAREDNIVISSAESRKFLKNVGIDGEIIQTPGHTDDSISLVIDGCCAFTGDLPEFALMEAYNDEIIKESWKLIQDYNVTKIYPAHGKSYTLLSY